MTKGRSDSDVADARDARLKAALKANLARRKSQARAREVSAAKNGQESRDKKEG